MTDDNQGRATSALNDALATGFETADFDALKAFYTEDAILLPPRSRPVKGRAAIAAFWNGVRNRFTGMTFTTGDVKPLADAVVRETGTYDMAAGEGAGQPSSGKYMIVWQKIDGTWYIDSSIWSRNPEAGQQQQSGRGQGRAGGQGAGARHGGPGGGGQGGGGQGGGGQGGYRQGGRQGGGYRQAGYGGGGGGGAGGRGRGGIGGQQGGIGGGGAGIGGGGRRGNPQQGGGRGQGGRGQSLYDDNMGLYSKGDD